MSKIDWSTLPTLAPTATEARSDPWSEWRDEKLDVTAWKPSSYGSSYTISIPDEMLTTGSYNHMVYISDGNTYIVTTEDGTTVELDVKGNCITVNGYKITTDTIKNAIKKIQEEEGYSKPRT